MVIPYDKSLLYVAMVCCVGRSKGKCANIFPEHTVPMLFRSSGAKAMQEISCLSNTLWSIIIDPHNNDVSPLVANKSTRQGCTPLLAQYRMPTRKRTFLFITIAKFFRMLCLISMP